MKLLSPYGYNNCVLLVEKLNPYTPPGRTGVTAFKWGEAREDGNHPGDVEAGGPSTSPPAASQRRGPQPAAP